jgi:PPOX class probable F420-dependent enzyme
MPAGAEVPDSHRHLLDTQTAILATNGPDGLPQVTAVAFYHDKDDDLVKISLNDTRQKSKNLRRDPRVTLFILDPANRLRTLEIRATAEVIADPDKSFCATAGGKYNQDFTRHDRPGETRSQIVLHPTRVNATDLSA